MWLIGTGTPGTGTSLFAINYNFFRKIHFGTWRNFQLDCFCFFCKFPAGINFCTFCTILFCDKKWWRVTKMNGIAFNITSHLNRSRWNKEYQFHPNLSRMITFEQLRACLFSFLKRNYYLDKWIGGESLLPILNTQYHLLEVSKVTKSTSS